MAIHPPSRRIWWNEPIEKDEIVWIAIAFLWGLVMFGMMVYWHVAGRQNLSTKAYRIDPAVYEQRTEAFAEKYKVRDEGESGIPVAKPPPGADIYLLSRLWQWWPVLELEEGQTYRLHIMSTDWLHGFSLQPENINIQVHPGYEHVVTLTPTREGTYSIICNEYCGINHHTMASKLYVVKPKKG